MVSKSMAGLSYIERAHASNPLPHGQAVSRRFVCLFTLIFVLWMSASSTAWAQSDTKTIHLVALGDSLTAGYGPRSARRLYGAIRGCIDGQRPSRARA